ncbi:MAG: Secretion system C-terminal sorting domain, partial [Bacteroidota bacterium]
PTGFNGAIDDIAIYNRALTPEEVQELYTLDACTFTVYDTTYVTVYDTVTTYVTVTDTLLIDITFTGFEGQPSWLNTVMVFPNPASDHITIDYGNFALMTGYNTIITDAAGATVYSSAVNSQQVEIDINAWGAMGVYYMSVYDASGALVAVRHIVLE